MEDMDYMAFTNEDEIFKVLESEAAYASLSKEERMDYDRSLKAYRDYKNTISYASDQAREEGFERGMEKGMKKGMEKGMEKGMKKGRLEGRLEGRSEAMIEVAKKMKESGMDVNTISICSGLTISEIEKL